MSPETHFFVGLAELEEKLGLSFRDKSLLLRALTHRSSLNESDYLFTDNERLEFLGDAVIDLVVAELLYQRFPEQREGPLTAMRAALVRRETLAYFAQQLDLGRFLRLGRGEEDSGGRQRAAILCATFEALCGAIYLDQGITVIERFLLPLLDPELMQMRRGQLRKDAKSWLQEWAQAELNATPYYVTTGSTGPDHARTFHVEARVRDRVLGVGQGYSKQKAAQAAAEAALQAAGRPVAADPPEEREELPTPAPGAATTNGDT
ncbi:MAG: ribonuclease III [Caldilineales bacterium]|nr:ribonuclease III [Caldilineales bacterium]